MTYYKFECSHWWKIYFKKNPLQDLLSGVNDVISTNERMSHDLHCINNTTHSKEFAGNQGKFQS